MNVADMMILLYTAESTALRVEKMQKSLDEKHISIYKDILDVFVYDAAAKINKFAKDAFCSIEEDEKLTRLQKAAATVAGIAGLAGGAYYMLMRRPLPKTNGTLRLAELHEPVEIVTDRYGVPHIYANNEDDLYLAQGYLIAQELYTRQGKTAASQQALLEAKQLLSSVGLTVEDLAPPASPAPSPSTADLVEPLTARETDVLRLLAAGLSNREIAEELTLSLNTVKTHSKNLYGKLGVHTRMQAALRARQLGLL